MSNIIAIQTAPGTSSDFTLTDGQTATVFLVDADGGTVYGTARIEVKDAAGSYYPVPNGNLDANQNAVRVAAPGTYRVSKDFANTAFGVDKV